MVDAVQEVWKWLDDVADPEIPTLSVVDLGIVRAVRRDGGEVIVTVTPTYSGCPATEVIRRDIESALRAHGIERPQVETVLAPAWTTDWITPRGRQRLEAAGIAPPGGSGHGGGQLVTLQPQQRCPHCGAVATERISQFGATPCKALYRCLACREPFEYFKPH